jgi:hypothetical protein
MPPEEKYTDKHDIQLFLQLLTKTYIYNHINPELADNDYDYDICFNKDAQTSYLERLTIFEKSENRKVEQIYERIGLDPVYVKNVEDAFTYLIKENIK